MDIFELSRQKLLVRSNNPMLGLDEENTDGEKSGSNESTIIVSGNQNCGKTTLIHRFMEKSADNTRTVGLDFNHVTRFRNNVKEICSIWEVGGGAEMANLVKIPLNKSCIENCSVFVFIDLSTPADFADMLLKTMQVLEDQMALILKEINVEDHERFDRIKSRATKGANHKDGHVIQPLNIPTVFVVSRYDQFQNFETEKKKNLYKFIRFFAHIHNAHVTTFISNGDSTVSKLKSLMSCFAFHEGKVNLQSSTDVMKPLVVLAGSDSFESIGVMNGAVNPPKSYREAVMQWRDAIDESFPQNEKSKNKVVNVTTDKQFAEYEIDATVEQRRRELELFSHEKVNRRAVKQKAAT